MRDQNNTAEEAQVPVDFDAGWYRATYPDVGMSKLDAREHYRKFGRIMGRCPNARALAVRREKARSEAMASMPQTLAQRFGTGPLPGVEGTPLSYERVSPLIAGPDGQDPAGTGPVPAPAQSLAGMIKLDGLAGHPGVETLLAPVAAYFRMLGVDTPAGLFTLTHREQDAPPLADRLAELAERRPECGGAQFRQGPAQIRDAWFADEGRLRLALAGAEEGDAAPGLVLRAYQSLPDAPGRLQQIGGAGLAAAGPSFVDAAVINPLMPVLLTLSGRTGLTLETALLPFPSLLRGGLHASERAAFQVGASPVEDMWRLSAALLTEFLAPEDGAALAVSRLTVDPAGATGAERLASAPVRHWLAAVFGLCPEPETPDSVTESTSEPETDPGAAPSPVSGFSPDAPPLNPRLARRQSAPGLTLHLAADNLPTLACLTSRRLRLPKDQTQAAGPFLVAETVSGRPLWSVSLPMPKSRAEHARGLPLLRAGTRGRTAPPQKAGHWLAPLHLAIRMVAPEQANETQTLMPAAPDMPARPVARPVEPEPMSVVLRARDPALVRRSLRSLSLQEDIRIADLLLCVDAAAGADRIAALRAVGEDFHPGQVRTLPVPAGGDIDLDRAAAMTIGPVLCLIDEQVVLYDPGALDRLQVLLEADPTAASIGCAVLHEIPEGKSTRIRGATAGLFPAQVSLISSPRLGVTQPDSLTALPGAVYPVLANSFELSLIRRDSIEQTLPHRDGWMPGPASADLKFGLDAAAAGLRSLCTTQVRVGTTARARPRDEIDPFGLACVLPARWDKLLSAVTVLRQLRG